MATDNRMEDGSERRVEKEDIRLLDAEERIDSNRTKSRLIMMLGVFFLLFAGFWLIYAGQDIRDGRSFTIGLLVISSLVGLVLIVAGAITRSHQPMLQSERRRSRTDRAA